jgi:D-arabinitol dehydrogenase (NADP+)
VRTFWHTEFIVRITPRFEKETGTDSGDIVDGGFAEYCAYPAEKLFHFENCSWEEASLFEVASCAVHGMDRIRPEVGSNILLIGAGPTGLCLAQ